jgi:imidazolonepropionase-like amidohydrolase
MPKTLFTNATLVLDGCADLQPSFNVLVKDGRIVSVSPKPVDVHDATVIDIGGRTLMPGLIDAHAHITGLSLTPKNIAYPAAEIAIAAANYLRACLMDGYTTIREAGGADHATARLLAEGHIIGPPSVLFRQGADADRRGSRFSHTRRERRSVRPDRAVFQHVGDH